MDFTEGKPWKQIIYFAIPILLGLLLQQLYNTVDAVILGNYTGEAALAAIGTTGCITLLYLSFANGFSAGANVVIAKLFGAKQMEEARETAATAIMLLLGMGVAISVIGILSAHAVLENFLGIKGQVLEMALEYLYIYTAGLFFQFGYNVVAGILRAVGDSKASLYFLIIAFFVNIILDVVFIAKLGWDCRGAALATNIAQAASFAAAWLYMYRKYPVFRFHVTDLQFVPYQAKKILWAGLPIMLQGAVASTGFIFLQKAINAYGQSMIAACTVGQRVETYLNMAFMAFQTTMATYTGQNVGAKRMDRVMLGLKQAVALSMGSTVVLGGMAFLGAPLIARLFALNAEAAAYAREYIRFTSVIKLIVASYFPIIGMFQGTGNGFIGSIAVASALFMRVLTIYTLCYVPWIGYHIAWGNQLFGFSTACIIVWSCLLFTNWRKRIKQL